MKSDSHNPISMQSSIDIVDTKRVETHFSQSSLLIKFKNHCNRWCMFLMCRLDSWWSHVKYAKYSLFVSFIIENLKRIIFGKIVIAENFCLLKIKVPIWDEEIYDRKWSLMKREKRKKCKDLCIIILVVVSLMLVEKNIKIDNIQYEVKIFYRNDAFLLLCVDARFFHRVRVTVSSLFYFSTRSWMLFLKKIYVHFRRLYALSSSSSSVIDKMNDFTLRVKNSRRRYRYLNIHHLTIAVWDSRTSIQVWNTEICLIPLRSDIQYFNFVQFTSFFQWKNHSRVFIWKFLQSMSDFPSSPIQKIIRAHVWEIENSKEVSIAKISRKRCMLILFHLDCLRISCSCNSFEKLIFFDLISWIANQKCHVQ